MSTERDELAALIWDNAVADRVRAGKDLKLVPVVRAKAEAVADAILAAGYRKPRTITTAEELDALPLGAILLDCYGDTARKFRGGWRTTVAEPDGTAWLSGCMEDPDLPAAVLHEPEPRP